MRHKAEYDNPFSVLSRDDRSEIAKAIRLISRDRDFCRRYNVEPVKLSIEADRFDECGRFHAVHVCSMPGCGVKFRVPCTCKTRICPECARKYGNELKAQISSMIGKLTAKKRRGWLVAMLTLTFQSGRFKYGIPTPEEIRRCGRQVTEFLRCYYGKFKSKRSRNGRIYASRTYRGAGGLAVMEIGPSGNVHFHCVVYGPYIAQRLLSQKWLEITGDSYIIDIRPLKGGPLGAARYVMKYILKPVTSESYVDYALVSMMLKGVRRVRTFGVLYNQVKNLPRDKVDFRCLFCGSKLDFRGVHKDCRPALEWFRLHKRGSPIPQFRKYDMLLDYVQNAIAWEPYSEN